MADYISRNAADVPDNILLKSFVAADVECDMHVGEHVRTQMASIHGLISREEASILLTRAAMRIRDPDYKLKEFHADMVKCFPGPSNAISCLACLPSLHLTVTWLDTMNLLQWFVPTELQLYLGGREPAADTVEVM